MPEYLPDDWGEDVVTRAVIQLRVPAFIYAEVDRIAEGEALSNNEWVVRALRDQLQRDEPLLYPLTAERLLTNRRLMNIRLESGLGTRVRNRAKRRGVTLTVWVLDAMLSKMAALSAKEGR